jgi:sulfide:quinone oxidoreductase
MSRIVIAGGGIAGLEALIALRGHLGPTPAIELLEPNPRLEERQRSVASAFDPAPLRRLELAQIADDHGAHLRADRIGAVDP